MSLHIDLFTDDERANPSDRIVLTMMMGGAAIVILGLILYVSQAFFMLQASQSALASARRRNDNMKQNHKVALALIEDIAAGRACLEEMKAFSNVQIHVSAQLYAISVAIPPDIQLTKLSIDNALVAGGEKNDLPARQYIATITGRTDAEGVNERVSEVIAEMNAADGLLGVVTPGGVSVDPAKSSDRIFEINFSFEPRVYRFAAERKSK